MQILVATVRLRFERDHLKPSDDDIQCSIYLEFSYVWEGIWVSRFSDVKEMFLKYPTFVRYKDHLDPIGPDEEDETRLFALLLSHVDRAIEKWIILSI